MELGSVYSPEAFSARRHRGPVLDHRGEAKVSNKPAEPGRPEGKRIIDFKPIPKPTAAEQSKRCYGWTHRPTGHENPEQWEDPPVPGARPSHPVSATGVVALEQKRTFPEQQWKETSCPGVPRLSAAPFGSEWGGWARSGAPGRKPLVQPWDSLRPKRQPAEGEPETDYRFCDARKKPFPEMTYGDTSYLTRWHLDARADADPVKQKRVHLNTPREAGAAAASMPAAGKRSGMVAEGTSMEWYERMRAAEMAAPPHTAR